MDFIRFMSRVMIFIKNFGLKNGFQHRGLINHVPAKGFINPGGPPFFNYKKNGQRGLINTAGFINPNLTLHRNTQKHAETVYNTYIYIEYIYIIYVYI